MYLFYCAKSEGSRKDLNKLHWHTLNIKLISLINNPSGYGTYQQKNCLHYCKLLESADSM